MRCPFCTADDTRVIDTRLGDSGDGVRRRRECTECEQRFTTAENIVFDMPSVVKADGRREKFDAGKLRRGITRALEKRPLELEAIDGVVNRVMRRFTHQRARELAVERIGEAVMYELSQLDEVAYVRFASVYCRFQDADAFNDEVTRLRESLGSRDDARQHSLLATPPDE